MRTEKYVVIEGRNSGNALCDVLEIRDGFPGFSLILGRDEFTPGYIESLMETAKSRGFSAEEFYDGDRNVSRVQLIRRKENA